MGTAPLRIINNLQTFEKVFLWIRRLGLPGPLATPILPGFYIGFTKFVNLFLVRKLGDFHT